MKIEPFICRKDNIAVIIHDEPSSKTIAIDAPDAQHILRVLQQYGWSLDYLLITHHHTDHTEGINALKAATNVIVIGPHNLQTPIANLDHIVHDSESFYIENHLVKVISTPGHTLDSICYYLPFDKIIFTGDTLFSLGCGRIFEGSPAMMFSSLEKIMALPDDTRIYCGHEYTEENGRFAQTIEPENIELQRRLQDVSHLRAQGKLTIPSTIALEKATNPFLRWNSSNIHINCGLDNADNVRVFSEIRKLKDCF